MEKRLQEKLRSRSGETLAEVLIALLIIALSTMLLVVMINTAGSIDIATRGRDKTFYDALASAETHDGDGEHGKIKIAEGVNTLDTIDVTVYGGNGLTAYGKAGGGDEP